MKLLPESVIVQSQEKNNLSFPVSVDITCPHCGRLVNFTVQWNYNSLNLSFMGTHSRCTACREIVTFLLMDAKPIDENESSVKKGKLYVYPSPHMRDPINGIHSIDGFRDGLQRAYDSTINVYNDGHWSATAVLCRRVLEGITKSLLSPEAQKENLYKQIEQLPGHVDLQKPILKLADAIRKGGNLGAHFDLEKEPDQDTATLMIDLLDYLIEYLFILPQRIDELFNRIEKTPTKEE